MKHYKLKRRFLQICKECGQGFLIKRCWLKRKTKVFCSKKCVGLWRSKNYIGARSPAAKFVFITCHFCGETKKRIIREIINNKFCSKGCQQSFNDLLGYGKGKQRLIRFDSRRNKIFHGIEEIRRHPNIPGLLEVSCTYCGKWFAPTKTEVANRILSIKGKQSYGWGEARFYCSKECKKACPVFNQKKYPKGFQIATSREVQPELRKMVFERDDWTCQKCGIKWNLHCHHLTGVELNPIESADVDNCITFCKDCHEKVHSEPNCFPSSLIRKKCGENNFSKLKETLYN